MADVTEIAVRLDVVEKGLDREIAKREEANKYVHRMVEDVQARYQDIAVSFGRIEAAFTQHIQDDKQMITGILDMDRRVRTIERLAWIAIGGIGVIGGLFVLVSAYMVKALGG